MNPKSSVSLQFQRPDARAEFERARRETKAALTERVDEEAANALLEIASLLDVGVARAKRELLASTLAWNEDNRALAVWIHQQHRAVFEMGLQAVEPLRADPGNANLPRLVLLCLHHWTEALKWNACREREEYGAVHGLYMLAAHGRFVDRRIPWTVDGRGVNVTVEVLYLRALFLDRFASGTLTRAQEEILDAWLWQWSTMLKAERSHAGGTVLRAEPDGTAGLREGPREGEGPALYLRLEPLEAERRKVVRELQRGRIVPPHGLASELRIEEHIVVLDYLRRAFRTCGPETTGRAPRECQAGLRIEVWVGLSEVLMRGVGVGVETGRWRALQVDTAAIDQQAKQRFVDAARRYLWMANSSATGFGFEALESDATGIELGDLIGWRNAGDNALVLGQVIRRMPSATCGQVFIGVKTLTEAALPMPLSQDLALDERLGTTYLFVPGDDDSGRRDAFLVPEKMFDLQPSFSARMAGEPFTLRFNRVRGRGRGWILAGFEIVPPQPEVPAAQQEEELELSLPTFELELDPVEVPVDEDTVAQAFERELPARLHT